MYSGAFALIASFELPVRRQSFNDSCGKFQERLAAIIRLCGTFFSHTMR